MTARVTTMAADVAAPARQDLSAFTMPANFRGRSAIYVQLWWLVQALVFKPLPQVAYPLRRGLLRLFGARVGERVLIRPGVTVTYPWKVSIGDRSWIGDNVTLYSLGEIRIGSDSVVSQESYLCAGDHDPLSPDFAIRARPVLVGDGVWIAARSFVGPGVTVGDQTVVGSCSVVMRDLPAGVLAVGNPCKPVRPRVFRGEPELATRGEMQ